ncbi:hypothetical protein IKD67_03125 [Candidatus Saccharibacteria bacterium]|nr:hypothetical protein [Candidatus Saccharibacteria bacterium]
MKKTHKKIFGLFGLALVVAVTVFAAFLPGPETKATTDSVVDNLSVRVVGATPSINISGITPGSEVVSGSQEINITYENIDKLIATITYTDADGNVHEQSLMNGIPPVDYIAGVSDVSINLLTGEYSYSYQYLDPDTGEIKTYTDSGTLTNRGYGEYVLSFSGEGAEGTTVEKKVNFTFLPVTANVTQDGDNVTINLDYDKDSTGGSQIGGIEIYVYDDTGKLMDPFPVTVIPPDDSFTFNPKDYGYASGTYTVSVQAYDTNGTKLYKPYITTFDYQTGEVTPTPNTGGVMGDLNISKTDYIITGLIIFSIVGISGAVFISKHDKKVGNRRR